MTVIFLNSFSATEHLSLCPPSNIPLTLFSKKMDSLSSSTPNIIPDALKVKSKAMRNSEIQLLRVMRNSGLLEFRLSEI